MFIISSETFNQAYKRIIFLREYSRARKAQALQITKNQDSLAINKERLFSQQQLIKLKKEQNQELISNKKQSKKDRKMVSNLPTFLRSLPDQRAAPFEGKPFLNKCIVLKTLTIFPS